VRNGDPDCRGRRPERLHDSQSVVGVRTATVALYDHAVPGREGDHVRAVLKPPDGTRRVGDWLPEQLLKLGGIGFASWHAPEL
jgi:hypothetical protein